MSRPQGSDVWGSGWRGRWIWGRAPEPSSWWHPVPVRPDAVHVRHTFDAPDVPVSLPVRATCDSRYVLFVNGRIVGRGPVRGEPEHLGWDEHDLADHLVRGRNVLVALCRYYGQPGPWWVPAAPLGTLGRGSFCLETAPGADIELLTGPHWQVRSAPWISNGFGGMHSFPPEIVDGRIGSDDLHDPDSDVENWSEAVVVSGHGHGTVLDRPPAAPYMTPLQRPIPQLTTTMLDPRPLGDRSAVADITDDPLATWVSLSTAEEGDRHVTVWDLGRISLGHLHMRITKTGTQTGAIVDVSGGEDLRDDGLPEIRPREWVARYIVGPSEEQDVTFFDPIGLRYIAAHSPPGVDVSVRFEEAVYPRVRGASFSASDERYSDLWEVGLRTVDVCSTDAFLDCPGREQRAWVSDAYPQILVSLVTNPDQRLVRHHLDLTSRSRFPSGLLAGAAGCDFARIGFTMPEYSLHWIRSLAAYWRYSGDEPFVRANLSVADAIIERYERQRGPSGLLEDFPGWVFLDWAQVDRDVITGAHDALYATALEDYRQLPGASDVAPHIEATRRAFEALWDDARGVYVDAIGPMGPSRRISQHTNATALLADLVPAHRVEPLIERITDPAGSDLGGRLVITATSADARVEGRIPFFQYEDPAGFDVERDVVAAQPWFCRFVHEALALHGRRDLVLDNLLRWEVVPGNGTFQEFWSATPGTSSRCHGWSSSPTFDLTTYVLGVRPTAPGWGSATVEPHLGRLRWATGRVATPRGWLSVRVEGDQVDVQAPDGLEVTVAGSGRGAHGSTSEVEEVP